MLDSRPSVVSLFSGVGGLELGLENAGMRSVYQCEIDPHCRQILDHHWPGLPRWGDVSTLTGAEIMSRVDSADVVAWGSPCQDLSVAGKRAGLEGSRSGLFYEGMRIIRELREESGGRYPRISIWENVAGALNSNRGADFGVILDEMAEAGALVQEWRLLDAQHFGVPQRRRRVFLVAVFDPATAANCPDPLLPVSQGVRWDSATSRTARQNVASAVTESVTSSGHRMRGFGDYADDDTASAIKARDYKDATDLVVGDPILIDRAAMNQGVNALYEPVISDNPVVPTLSAQGPHGVATYIGFSHTQGLSAQPSEEAWPTLRKEGSGHAVATLVTEREGKPGGGKGPLLSDEKSLSLRTSNAQVLFTPDAPEMSVRRLTPLECERLMGWPDDWTRWRADGKEQKDSHRYKQCGNGVASPVTQWIGGIIVDLLRGVSERSVDY